MAWSSVGEASRRQAWTKACPEKGDFELSRNAPKWAKGPKAFPHWSGICGPFPTPVSWLGAKNSFPVIFAMLFP